VGVSAASKGFSPQALWGPVGFFDQLAPTMRKWGSLGAWVEKIFVCLNKAGFVFTSLVLITGLPWKSRKEL